MAMLSKSKDPAKVSTTVNTKVDKPKIKANVPIMESRSCHKFIILSLCFSEAQQLIFFM